MDAHDGPETSLRRTLDPVGGSPYRVYELLTVSQSAVACLSYMYAVQVGVLLPAILGECLCL